MSVGSLTSGGWTIQRLPSQSGKTGTNPFRVKWWASCLSTNVGSAAENITIWDSSLAEIIGADKSKVKCQGNFEERWYPVQAYNGQGFIDSTYRIISCGRTYERETSLGLMHDGTTLHGIRQS